GPSITWSSPTIEARIRSISAAACSGMAPPRAWCLALAAGERDQVVGEPLPVAAQAVVLVLVGDPGAQAPHCSGGLERQAGVHVHVVVVHRGGTRHLVGGQLSPVVQRGPGGQGGPGRR